MDRVFEDIEFHGSVNGARVYRALLSQAGTADPTAVVLENTLGDIVWTRASTGVYEGTLADGFPTGKTWVTIGTFSINTPDLMYSDVLTTSIIQVIHYYLKLILGDVGKEALDTINDVPIEIRVYD